MTEETAEILLIEDSADDATFFKHAFEKAGMTARLRIVVDGAEALEFISSTGRYANRSATTHPKVIVLDLKLPKVDGQEVLRRLKREPSTLNIPIVVFSSSPEERDLVACYNLGVSSYVVKPMDIHRFSQSVRQLCEYWVGLNQIPKS